MSYINKFNPGDKIKHFILNQKEMRKIKLIKILT